MKRTQRRIVAGMEWQLHLSRRAMPTDAASIAARLRTLGRESAGNMADQLELLVRFDDVEGWGPSGARHCTAWMNQELQISLQLGWEYLRAGRRLPGLIVTR